MQPRDPLIFVAFGITGDLMRIKILPSLFQLFKKKKLPAVFQVVGISRQSWSDEELRAYVRNVLASLNTGNDASIHAFANSFYFHKGDVHIPESYASLKHRLATFEHADRVNKLFYLSISPELFELTLEHLAEYSIVARDSGERGWSRLIIEKPFGKDLSSARQLNTLIRELFDEDQIYRADHYLAKQSVQNILTFRKQNDLFGSKWSNESIVTIDITLIEELGVEKRGAFYDAVGALRDMGQSHMLEILALLTMDKPEQFNALSIRQKRAEILQNLVLPEAEHIHRGQYMEYGDIPGVAPDSKTETYFKVTSFLSSPQWKGIPISLEHGKRMDRKQKEIAITLRHGDTCCHVFLSDGHDSAIIFQIDNQDIFIEDSERRVAFTWSPEENLEEEYEKIIYGCMQGDQTFFVSMEEIEAMWKYIDSIEAMWQQNSTPLEIYLPN